MTSSKIREALAELINTAFIVEYRIDCLIQTNLRDEVSLKKTHAESLKLVGDIRLLYNEVSKRDLSCD
jgi:hypothetical protein